jgi:nucleotide-binding universal stress UspA family protein
MIDRILIPLDGSVNAEKIAGWSEGLAEAFGSQLILLSVVDPETVERPDDDPGRDRPARDAHPLDQPAGNVESSGGIAFGGTIPFGTKSRTTNAEAGYGTQAIEQAAQARNSYISVVASRLAERGLNVRAMVTIGKPEDEILRVAEEEGVDLITMATHRESLLARGILGSVTDRVIHQSSVPILTIRPENVSETTPHKPEIVLVPLDGPVVSESAVSLATSIAKKANAHLLFVRASNNPYQSAMGDAGIYYPSPMSYLKASNHAGEYLEPFVDRAKKLGVSASMKTPTGSAEICLISIANENDNTLTVIGTRGQGGIKRFIVGSVTDKVIRSSGNPVLVVPPKHP